MKKGNIRIDWEIISKSFRGELTGEEREKLDGWLAEAAEHREFYERAARGGETDPAEGVERRVLAARKTEVMRKAREVKEKQVRRRRMRYTWYAAAAVLIAVVVSVQFLWQNEPKEQIPEKVALLPLPGKRQATLVLASGESVYLQPQDTLNEITQGAGVKVTNKKGSLVYKDSAEEVFAAQYNELMTPRGGEYQVVLADGTTVWLNADSRLKYPVAFDRDKREVYLTGEAYFEVVKDVDRPFYVVTNEVRIKVYGTGFNVNTYHMGLVRTTLVHGKVGVTVNETGQETMLRPNEMLEYDPETGRTGVKEVDVYNYIAWKFGEFVFENERLDDIMEQLRLWYDVEVFYANDEVRNVKFTGDATRFSDITDVLSILEKTGSVCFMMKGRTITVYSRIE